MPQPHAQHTRQDIGLGHRHRGRAGGQHRADRQVDVTGHDHEDHTGRHNGNADRLDREVENIARRQKAPVGQHVEHEADQNERTDHP